MLGSDETEDTGQSLTAAAVLSAFNVHPPKGWTARIAGTKNIELVHFQGSAFMVTFIYHVKQNRFAVKFTKYQGAFGDYMASIGRGLHVILTALQAGGMRVAAPPSNVGIRVECELDEAKNVWCRWAPDEEWPPTLENVIPVNVLDTGYTDMEPTLERMGAEEMGYGVDPFHPVSEVRTTVPDEPEPFEVHDPEYDPEETVDKECPHCGRELMPYGDCTEFCATKLKDAPV